MTDSARSNVIDGQEIARTIYEEVDAGIASLRERGVAPHLVAVQVGHDAATDLYVDRQKSRLARRGIRYTHLALDGATGERALLHHIDALNANPDITGIILTLPMPEGIEARRVQERIWPQKDVEGVNPTNLGRLIYDRSAVGPCTALAVLSAIEWTSDPVEGKHVVMVGHSDIVGKPVGLCLVQEMATITTCHIATRDLARHTREADILVVAVGKPGLVTAQMVREGATVIDVGINRLPDGRVVGDVSYEDVAPRCRWITPVPGGVGPITVAMLARNTWLCARDLVDQE